MLAALCLVLASALPARAQDTERATAEVDPVVPDADRAGVLAPPSPSPTADPAARDTSEQPRAGGDGAPSDPSGTSATAADVASPGADVASPAAGLASPAAGLASPAPGLGSPAAGLASPAGPGASARAPGTSAAADESALHAGWSEPEPLAHPPPFGGRAYVARYSLRPLTVGEGVLAIDSGSAGRFGGTGSVGFGIHAAVAFGARLGITDDLEVGASIGVATGRSVAARDPVVAGTLRFFHDGAADVGVSVSVRIPAITTGDTVVRAGVPLVVRGGNFFRLAGAIEIELLCASNVSPLFAIPVQLAFSTSERFSLGVEGWFGLLDGRDPLGAVGAFVQATGRTPVRALWDVRWAMAYLVAERAVQVTSAVSFYPQLW